MSEICTRTLTLDRKAAKGNSFPAVAATETPVRRHFGYEVLDMSRMDLSRVPLPVIESHNQGTLNIGVFEDVRVEGGKLRGMIRLGKSARAMELAEDIREGIVRNVSVGYEADDPVQDGELDGQPVFRFAATPHELSLVAAPADINSGIFRSKDTSMENQKPSRQDSGVNDGRVSAIRAMADKYNLDKLGMQAISENWSVEDFNARALNDLSARNVTQQEGTTERTPVRNNPNHYAGLPCDNTQYGRAMEKYSLTRIMRGIADPKALGDAGLELEISQDIQRVTGKRSKGVMIPFEALQQRAITYGGTGSSVVATDHLAGSFIDVLRARSMILQMNPTVLRGLEGNVAIPKKTAGATAYWVDGDGTALTESTPTLAQVTMSPKTVGGAVSFTHRMIMQSSPDIEQIVRRDLSDLIASEIDLKAIAGTGANDQPTGILATGSIGSTTYANGGAPDWADLVGLETTIAAANADTGSLGYLTTPALAGALKLTDKGTDTANYVWTGRNAGGEVNGYRAFATSNMTAGYIVFGNFQELLVGFWGGIEIDADPYGTNFLKGSVTVRVFADIDIDVRHPASFAEIHEAAP